MPDTKKGRDKQAREKENRQRERELQEARDRADEAEPPRPGKDDATEAGRERDESPDSARACHRRGCTDPAMFVVLERYQEETGQGAVEAEAFLCRAHTDEESPANLDSAYADYVFRIEPIGKPANSDTT